MIVGLLDLELSSEHGGASAGIDNVTGLNWTSRTIASHRQLDALVRELDGFNRSLLVHFRAGLSRMVEQELVEIAAGDLIGVIGLRAIAVLEVKFRARLGTRAHDFAPVLLQEASAHKFCVQTDAGECLHTERQQGLAYVKPRKLLALEHNYAPAR